MHPGGHPTGFLDNADNFEKVTLSDCMYVHMYEHVFIDRNILIYIYIYIYIYTCIHIES